jgi:hypothetical protein
MAIFTDGLENASKIYSSKDINYKLKQVEKEGWEVKFFCRYEDETRYKRDLDLSPNIQFSLSMDDKGLKIMESQIRYSIDNLMKTKRKSNQGLYTAKVATHS